jgi:type II secretory pathway pseudopilin PulG
MVGCRERKKLKLKQISVISGILISLTVLIGTLFTLDSRWAKAEIVQQLAARLEQKIQSDRADNIQERLWRLEDKFGYDISKMPPAIRDQYRNLQKEWQEITKKLGANPDENPN